jgi:hypothetical protein
MFVCLAKRPIALPIPVERPASAVSKNAKAILSISQKQNLVLPKTVFRLTKFNYQILNLNN